MIIVIIIVSVIVVFFLGFKAGSYFINKENEVLYKQNTLLQTFSNHWANAARSQHELTQDIAEHQTSNLTSTIQAVVYLLSAFERQNAEALSSQENEKITQLINQAKSLTSP